jgi:transcriptional regulator with XRE-family HTH domain
MDMAEVIKLSDRLKATRSERGISQAQAARELDVARTAYRLWEMEAARPAPDRWRLVARWLGVSMTTLLLAEGLISEDEATTSDTAEARYEDATGETSDVATEREGGTFFEQGLSYLVKAQAQGVLTPEEAEQFGLLLARIRREVTH